MQNDQYIPTGIPSSAKNHFFKIGMVALVLLCAFLFVKTISASKEIRYVGGGVPSTNTISVSGEGEVFAFPDIATVTFTIRKQAKLVTDAQKSVTTVTDAALSFLDSQAIDEKDIKTTNYTSYPQYDYRQTIACTLDYCPPAGTPVISGYEVVQTISVKIRDTEKVGAILDGLTSAGVNEVYGPEFTIDDQTLLEEDARKLAIEQAKEKARKLADDLDVRLVRIVSFSEGGQYTPYYSFSESASMNAMADQKSTPTLPAGENRIVSSITITYEIR